MSPVSFDEALILFCKTIVDRGLERLLDDGIFVRTLEGQIQLVVLAEKFNFEEVQTLTAELAAKLGRYLVEPPDSIIKDTDSPVVDQRHLALPERLEINGEERTVLVIDRRTAGQDWLRRPVRVEGGPPRLVFWSLKGGVGRTTALVALAASLAKAGQNVLVIDLDLEAPGVSDFLLAQQDKPAFGVLDYLVEDAVGNVSKEELFANLTATSGLVQGQGLIDVCPAAGTRSIDSPQNYLAKLFRAYPAVHRKGGATEPFIERIGQLATQLEGRKRYDAVLIDARAGLNESTAAALLGLGGDVLMFGHETLQTFAGYRFAFAHFSRLAMEGDSEWRLKLKMVHAKAPASSEIQKKFRDQTYELMSDWIYEAEGDFSFSPDDPDAPHYPWVILDDSNYRVFDPIDDPDLLDGSVFNATFGEFIRAARARLRIDAT